MITKFKDYITEKYQNTESYLVGDKVFIRYHVTGDVTPVKIVKKLTKNNIIVSHKVDNSFLYNAPDHEISLQDIVGRYSGTDDEVGLNPTVNPNIRPDTSGLIPGWNSWNNDMSFY